MAECLRCMRCPGSYVMCYYCSETQGSQPFTCVCQYTSPMAWVPMGKVSRTWAAEPPNNHNIKSSESNQSSGTNIDNASKGMPREIQYFK